MRAPSRAVWLYSNHESIRLGYAQVVTTRYGPEESCSAAAPTLNLGEKSLLLSENLETVAIQTDPIALVEWRFHIFCASNHCEDNLKSTAVQSRYGMLWPV